MKKFFLTVLLIMLSIVLTGCGNESKQNILKKATKKISNCNGYQIQAKLKLYNNDDVYNYDVSVSYKEKDKFRVSLMNKVNNHEQIILKNDNGVYVLSPNLNKSFKFQSNWPYDNSQSYIMQSVLNDIKNDKNYKMKKTKEGYVFTSKVNYKNNKNLTHQEVVIDKNYKIKKVIVLDSEENPQIKVKFTSYDLKAKFGKEYFSLEKNMEVIKTKSETKNTISEAIYPMYLPDNTYLDKESVVNLDEGSRIILTFAGDNPFMLIEETSSVSKEPEIIPSSGDIDLFVDGIAIIDDTSVSWTSDGIEYYLVSSDLSKSELLEVAKSLSTIPITK